MVQEEDLEVETNESEESVNYYRILSLAEFNDDEKLNAALMAVFNETDCPCIRFVSNEEGSGHIVSSMKVSEDEAKELLDKYFVELGE